MLCMELLRNAYVAHMPGVFLRSPCAWAEQSCRAACKPRLPGKDLPHARSCCRHTAAPKLEPQNEDRIKPVMTFLAPGLSHAEAMTGRSTHVRVLVAGPHLTAQSAFVKALASALSRTSSSPAAAASTSTAPEAGAPSIRLLQHGSVSTTHAADSISNRTKHGNSSNLLLSASDPFTAFQLAPGAWVTHVAAPGDTSGDKAHSVLYSLQAVPGWASTPDAAAYLETVTRVVLDAQQQEFKRLHDSCGAKGDCVSNPNSSTISDHFCQVCLYLLPPSGPTATDLVMLASLSRTLPLVPLVTPLVSPGCDPVTQGAAEALLEEVACLLADPGQLVTGLKAGDIRMPLGGPLLLHAKVRSLAPGRNPTYGAEEGDASHAGGISGAFTGPAAAAAASAAGSFCSGMSYCNRSAGSAGGSASHCSEDMDIWDLDMDLDMDLGAEVDLEAARDPAGRALNSSSPRAAAGYHSKPAATCHSRSSSSSSSSSNHSSLFQLPVSAAAGAALGSSSEEAFEWVALTAGPGQEGPSEVSQPDLCSGGTASNSSSARDAPSSWEQELPQQLLHGATSPLAATSAAGQAGVAEGGDVNRRSTTSAAGFDLDLQPVVELLTQGQASQLLRQLSREAFESFCADYQATAGNLEQQLAAMLQPFMPRLLAGPSLLQECVSQAKQQLRECETRLQKCEEQREVDGQAASRELEGQLMQAERHLRQQLQQLLQAAATEHQAAMSALRQQLVAEQQQAASKLAAVQEEADRQLAAVQQEADRQLALQQAEAEQQLAQQEERYIVLQQQMRVQQQRATAMLQQALNTAAAEQQWALNNVQLSMTQQQAETEQRTEDLQRQVQNLRRQLREERQAAASAAVQFDRSNAMHKQRYQRLWEQLLQERQQAGLQLQEAQQAAAEQHWRREMVQQQLQQEREQAAEQLGTAKKDHAHVLQQQVAAERQRAAEDKQAMGSQHQQEVAASKEQLLRVQQAAAAAAARHKEEAARWQQQKREFDQQLTRERATTTVLQQQLQEQTRQCKAAEQEAAKAAQHVEQLRTSAMQQFAAFKRLQLTAAQDQEGYEEALQQLRADLAEAQDKLGRQNKQLEGQIALHKWYRQAVC